MGEHLAIWTVGHSNHSLEDFARLVSGEQIEFLVDVRSYPYSRFAPQFNREALEPQLRRRGVGYLFLGAELGGRPDHEEDYDAEGRALYGPMSERRPFVAAIERLIDGARGHRIALMCSEADPCHCHRRLLVGKVLADRNVELRHILPSGEVVNELSVALTDDSQAALFDDRRTQWRSTQSVSRRRRLSASSSA
jgi:uncharacterized protein (DUF488 family)